MDAIPHLTAVKNALGLSFMQLADITNLPYRTLYNAMDEDCDDGPVAHLDRIEDITSALYGAVVVLGLEHEPAAIAAALTRTGGRNLFPENMPVGGVSCVVGAVNHAIQSPTHAPGITAADIKEMEWVLNSPWLF